MQDYKSTGICHICGELKDLTYEHVPPEKAFNNRKMFLVNGSELVKTIGLDQFPWDSIRNKKVKKVQKQRGIGWFTLCGECNNKTGKWYGDGFVDFIEQGYFHIKNRGGYSMFKRNSIENIQFVNVYPLRFIKQIITMFFSINPEGFSKIHPDLKEFVLKRDSKLDNKKYAIYMFFMLGTIVKYIGTMGVLQIKKKHTVTRVVSELSAPPFGFVLEIDPKPDNVLGNYDIIGLAKEYAFYDKTDIHVKVPVLESNTEFPLDFRSRQEIFNTYMKNKILEMNKKT